MSIPCQVFNICCGDEMNSFDIYLSKKKQLKYFKYKEIDLSIVASPIIARGVWNGLKSILYLFFSKIRFNSEKKCFDILFTYTCEGRTDHQRKVKTYCALKNIPDDDCISITRYISYNPIHYIYMFRAVVIGAFYIIRMKAFNIVSFLAIVRAIHEIDFFKKLNLKCQKYVAYNASDMEEAVLTQYFNDRETYGLQHGMYFKYINNPPLDVINYENFHAANFILWGQFSYDQISCYLPNKINIILSYDFYQYCPTPQAGNVNDLLVLLPRIRYKKEIMNLLSMLAKRNNSNFLIKCHPSLFGDNEIYNFILEYPKFKISNEGIEKIFSSCLFKACISFNSTVIFESILFKQRTICYVSKNDEFVDARLDCFENNEELTDLLESNYVPIASNYYFSDRINYEL
jgi:hypothetical protein